MSLLKGNFNWRLDKNPSPNKLPLLLLLIRQYEIGGWFSHQIHHNVEALSVYDWNLRQSVSGRLLFIAFHERMRQLLTNMVTFSICA